MKLNTIEVASLFLGFLSGVIVDFILLGCDSTSLGYRLLMLRGSVSNINSVSSRLPSDTVSSCKNTNYYH